MLRRLKVLNNGKDAVTGSDQKFKTKGAIGKTSRFVYTQTRSCDSFSLLQLAILGPSWYSEVATNQPRPASEVSLVEAREAANRADCVRVLA